MNKLSTFIENCRPLFEHYRLNQPSNSVWSTVDYIRNTMDYNRTKKYAYLKILKHTNHQKQTKVKYKIVF